MTREKIREIMRLFNPSESVRFLIPPHTAAGMNNSVARTYAKRRSSVEQKFCSVSNSPFADSRITVVYPKLSPVDKIARQSPIK